jgi:hypothetical protein
MRARLQPYQKSHYPGGSEGEQLHKNE